LYSIKNVVRASAASSQARWTPQYLCDDGMSRSLERLKNSMQDYSETIINQQKKCSGVWN
jgi:hypothetical protein